ncbi:MAG: hypothetical protein JF587_06885 [Catenulisporales bacterium]|nr:hypothetical protein [Catenulisporales bacterium]
MTLHRRLIPITALVVAIGASAAGAATAAATNGRGGGPATPKPPAPIVKCGVDVVDKGKEKGKSPDGKKDGSDVAKAAAALGITEKQLDDALIATKQWFGENGEQPTPDAFLQHVADLLHLPVAQVTKVLDESGIFRADQTDKKGQHGKTDQSGKPAPSGK